MLIGYSGHAWVVYDCFFSQGQIVTAYADAKESPQNPFGLRYLGDVQDEQVKSELGKHDYFVAIPDNLQRRQITEALLPLLGQPLIALHKTAVLSRNIQSGEGVMIGPRVIVNSGASLGNGVILHSGCIIDHGAVVGGYVSVGAGAIVGAGVVVGEHTSIGAGAVIVPGVRLGTNETIPAGAVISH